MRGCVGLALRGQDIQRTVVSSCASSLRALRAGPRAVPAAGASLAALLLGLLPVDASAQTAPRREPRRQFITVSADWLYTHPLHFAEHPLEDLVGAEVAAAQLRDYDYETRDGLTRIDVLEFSRRARGAGVTVYPLGLRTGATLGIRASFENLPVIRVAFEGPGAPVASYGLTNARAYDAGVGIAVADRSGGWGLGSVAFVVAGAGRIRSDLGAGRRLFAEGGGGLQSGPFGVQLAVKFAWNRLHNPVEHRFLTVPVTLRATVSF